MDDYEKLKEANKLYAEYIRQCNLSDEQIKEMKDNANRFIVKIPNNPILYRKVREEVFIYLKNLNTTFEGE